MFIGLCGWESLCHAFVFWLQGAVLFGFCLVLLICIGDLLIDFVEILLLGLVLLDVVLGLGLG